MKFVFLTLMLCFLALGAAAQHDAVSSPASGDLTVLGKKWRSDVRIPKLERDVEKEDRERQEDEFRRREIERLNETRREQGMPTREIPNRPQTDSGPDGIAVSYDYEVKVKNTGNRQIRAFTWEYIFLEPNSDRELGRRQFESEVRIGRGKTRTVTVRSSLPPADTVDVSKTGDNLKARYSEHVKIVSITYADGTVWTAPEN